MVFRAFVSGCVVCALTLTNLGGSTALAEVTLQESFHYELIPSDIFPWISGERKGGLSAEPNEAALALRDRINKAQKKIVGALYGVQGQGWFFNLVDKWMNKSKFKIGFVVDQREGEIGEWIPENFLYPDTAKLGVDLGSARVVAHQTAEGKPLKSSTMHDKFLVIDSETVWTGSANLTETDLSDSYNANISLIVDSPAIASLYEAEFQQMFTRKLFSTRKRSLGVDQNFKFRDGTKVEVLFSPQDKNGDERIIELIDGAKKEIDIAMFYLTHKETVASLEKAIKRGVALRLIYDGSASRHPSSLHATLWQAGGDVRVERWGGKMHMKTAVIDKKWSIIGSRNWSKNGEERNDENTLLIENPALAEEVLSYFDKLWKYTKKSARESDLHVAAESLESINSCFDGIDNDHDGNKDQSDPGCKR